MTYTEEEKKAYLTLKEELKILALKIKSLKPQHKQNQREFSTFTKENGSISDYFGRRMTSGQFELIRSDYSKFSSKQNNSLIDLLKMKDDFRVKHLMYCLARGTNLNKIESNPKKDYHYDDIMSKLRNLEKDNKILTNTLKYKRSKENLS